MTPSQLAFTVSVDTKTRPLWIGYYSTATIHVGDHQRSTYQWTLTKHAADQWMDDTRRKVQEATRRVEAKWADR